MKILEPLFIEVAKQLLLHEVEFLLIGGYAVNYYGYARYTGDLDFWLKPSNENKLKFLRALSELGKNKDDIKILEDFDFTQHQVITMGEVPLRIDFITIVNLVKFDDAWKHKNFLHVGDIEIPVIQYEHLIQTKINTHRAKDRNDIAMLQQLNGKKVQLGWLSSMRNLFFKK
jgi:hypothetical protein